MGRALERGLPSVTGGHGGLTAEVTFAQRPEGSVGVKHVDTRERAIQRKDPEEAAGRAEDRDGAPRWVFARGPGLHFKGPLCLLWRELSVRSKVRSRRTGEEAGVIIHGAGGGGVEG